MLRHSVVEKNQQDSRQNGTLDLLIKEYFNTKTSSKNQESLFEFFKRE
jgi:hypothetical protein